MVLRDNKGKASETEVSATTTRKTRKSVRAWIEEYQVDHKLGITARAAHFFNFLAEKAPHQLCPPAMAFRAIMGMAKTPRDTSDEVMRFRRRSSAIREALGRMYERGLVVEKPFGYMRATVDDEDLARTQQAREVDRIRSSVNAAKRTNDLISVSKIRDPAVRGWLKGAVSPLLKQLTEDDRIFRLAPKKEEEET